MADPKAAKLTAYYTDLKKFIDSGNHQKTIKAANKIIAEYEKEDKAWQCKAVSLIQLSQFNEALEFIKKAPCQEALVFEKAYCEYRLNNVEGSWKTISTVEVESPKIKELKAQILYRLERFEDCYSTYRDIVRTTSDDFDLERQTNLSAVSVNRCIYESDDDDNIINDNSTYELIYNHGTHLLAKGRIEEALVKLQEAETNCRKYLVQEEGASEEEINEEVSIIRVQQAYCLQLLSKEKEALSLYNSILKTKPEDPALLACINNNIVTINRNGNVFDSRKRIKVATAAGLEHKLTSHQRGTIALNQCLLAYHTQQSEVCLTEATKLESSYPHLKESAIYVKAAQLGKLGKLDEVVKSLNDLVASDSDQSTFVKLISTQILLSQGATGRACEVLSSIQEKDKFRAGIVSALVSLFLNTGNKAAASDILCKAVEWHKNNKTSSSELSELWRQAADFHLRGGDASTAAASLMQLHKLNPKDIMTLAQLITAYSQFDTKTAQELSKKLPPLGHLSEDLNIEALESAVGPKYLRKIVTGKGESSPATPGSPKSPVNVTTTTKSCKKKKRKPRLPKDMIEGVDPDPERWLPKWQRKTYKKNKRRNKDVGRGTQGVSSEAADKFDITKATPGQSAKPTGKPIIQQQTRSAPRNQKKSNKQKKKKSGW